MEYLFHDNNLKVQTKNFLPLYVNEIPLKNKIVRNSIK